MLFEALLFLPMFVKHAWTAAFSPRGRYPAGVAAKAAALYEAAFYIWALTLGVFVPAVAAFAVIHLVGVPLYFGGYLARYSKYGKAYAVFEAAELIFLAALFLRLA
ncbi:hypothetical protein TUZN_0770 [Thermoproteus uzoniensis 768-20]|uniref:Uncharacterized protein n=1 Tax=Thermoproteus uzoniensis (strain 768-20) TaxID=999630 RepID=F2L509_THEU7|nr:hypothetical protein [Thermoproteus uzoniensis]AEA12258.1 hypothetical protein TUZN_0770 [Thermoproteus uzoniensis 768-20]